MAGKKPANGKGVNKEGNIINELNRNPTEKNWELFKAQMKRDRAMFYFINYPTGIKEKDDLTKASATIYNARKERLYDVPIIKKVAGGIEGTTIYFKNLEQNRAVIR